MTAFTSRHVGIGAAAQKAMLETLGYSSLDALMDHAVPQGIRQAVIAQSTIPEAATEREALAELRALANENTVRRSMIGLGYYDTIMPSVIKRNVLENPSWYTAYTPYQPEISQGRLEALLTFQTMVSDLTGMTTANAGMLDEASAAAEAMLMARRASKSSSARFFVDVDAFPQTKAVLATRAQPLDIELVEVDWSAAPEIGEGFGGLVQYPGASGAVRDISAAIEAIHVAGGVAIVASDLLALSLLRSPGDMGADIVLGNSQRFGVPLGFGGPHSAFFAVRSGLERSMPGRLIGVSRDADGNPAYRLTLQAREQHIRREKATSNICTAQVLLAVLATMYAVYHGPAGVRAIALGVAERAARFADRARAAGLEVVNSEFFDTVQVRVPGKAHSLAESARAKDLLLYVVDNDTVQLSFDELSVGEHTGILAGGDDALVDDVFGLSTASNPNTALDYAHTALPAALQREGEILTHENFNLYHSETSMMRYLKRLADKDFALDRGMIPLGSCTMKLNAAAEMEAVSWREFGGIHPFAPAEDVSGYLLLTSQLEEWLTELTGYDSISLQPNAGSQGELAGLMAIRGYHLSRGDAHRTVCIIPSSAHGTNAASAVLAGMKVVVVACNENGDVDIDDLRAKIAENRDTLAALMVTYPSTHGVYEHGIREITDAVHEAGGQVYIDGANLNALLGFARYGDIGGDVSHLNLHKTFAIPHGGGGPGVGPVASKAHLAPFLPGHPFAQSTHHPAFDGKTGAPGAFTHGGGAVAGSPYGSASILPISWAYIRMMGSQGLRFATASAVLAANYVAAKLRDHYPVLYSGDNGLVAHECILDLRPLTAETGVTVDDVAKRLVDYGFHAPTMSFPVAGTLMVEPTESEDIAELDRFVDAMIAIRREADAVGRGEWPAEDNPLHNAPHTADSVISGEWTHPYSREVAAFPWRQLEGFALPNGHVKYWPAVRRVDGAYGDRNLVCACPDPSAFV